MPDIDAPIHLIRFRQPDELAMEAISEAAAEAFGVAVIPGERALDPRPAYDIRRDQYCSRLMLETLVGMIPTPDRVLGVADVDLFMPILTFVSGEAQLGGRGAVVSPYRLRESFYGLPDAPSVL
jgi:archaemetzincin